MRERLKVMGMKSKQWNQQKKVRLVFGWGENRAKSEDVRIP